MKSIPRFLGLALLALILTLILANCSLSSEQIFSRLEPSVVRVFYRNVPGHGTGFFVPGEKGVCTVLTAAHVVKKEGERLLETKDGKAWDVARVEIFPGGIDLALVTFRPEGRNCNYPALKIGNSDSLKKGSLIHISGFPIGGSNSGPDFLLGNVTRFGSFTEGYGISYDALAVGGMSGAPVVDVNGKVVAVHGTSKKGQEGLTFRWGIPINLFREYREKVIALGGEKQEVDLQRQLEEEKTKLEEAQKRVGELESKRQEQKQGGTSLFLIDQSVPLWTRERGLWGGWENWKPLPIVFMDVLSGCSGLFYLWLLININKRSWSWGEFFLTWLSALLIWAFLIWGAKLW
ncbi:MAG: trypsin-like peptidase domain-containing protein [Okeania sp. SIO2D1]|nr:trypsin-like peptidase domain-containing protein [Okeania sp. SIO2D1]